mmetsp:Transcript_11771/g.16654  ORF Transcript_11771/g.16654 Transcript_11771/m.16654 type:complete len:90 (-) Transcript_11771:73-342(-)
MEMADRAHILNRVGLDDTNNTRRSLNKADNNRKECETPKHRKSGIMGDASDAAADELGSVAAGCNKDTGIKNRHVSTGRKGGRFPNSAP